MSLKLDHLAQLRDLLESMPDATVIADTDGRIVFANTEAVRLFGYADGELTGRPVETLLPERLKAAHVGHRAGYASKPRTRRMGAGLELYGRRKDGSELPVEVSLSPLRTGEGRFVMSAIRDISERKRIEEALHDKNLELEKANQAKDRFLASMSHELRTPLNAIIGFTGTLLMRLPGPLTADQEKQLKTVQSSARHLLSLINDLLDLARIEAGKVELHPEAIECRGLLIGIADTLSPAARQKGLQLRLELPEAAVTLCSDRRALHQILLNLVNNAIKFTEQGEVCLRLAEQQAPDKRLIRFSVTDTGVGIRDSDQARLFQAFTQLDAGSTRRYEGTGLGLYLSQKLADLIGGKLTFASRFGAGSAFTLLLETGKSDERG